MSESATTPASKVCTRCDRELPATHFWKYGSRGPGALQAACKACMMRYERNASRRPRIVQVQGFTVGDRVRPSDLGVRSLETSIGFKERRSGTVVGFGRGGHTIRVRFDGRKSVGAGYPIAYFEHETETR